MSATPLRDLLTLQSALAHALKLNLEPTLKAALSEALQKVEALLQSDDDLEVRP